ncbi:hypothetical protein, partial [Mediterraneibacter faecis]|uniref:hypothetical protein n=1 Tax=Mediterraneibacter faecis TaxID=592978 RepID=UPI002ED48968|nr:hypothetical protein [Mediterraneibacter faecis]
SNFILHQFGGLHKLWDAPLAAQMGISVDTLQNYKLLAEMIPELSDLVDTGIVTKTTALAIISLFDNNRNS